jgi:hypothetical protein
MNLDSIKDFFSSLSLRDLPVGAAVLIGVVLLLLVLKAGKFVTKMLLLLVAVALFAGAYWWRTHK